MINMTILETNFRKRGFFFEQVWRKKDFAIYKRWRVTKDAHIPHYEVVQIKVHPAYELGGVKFEKGETYPFSEMWGSLAWTCQTLKEAQDKVEKVKLDIKNRK